MLLLLLFCSTPEPFGRVCVCVCSASADHNNNFQYLCVYARAVVVRWSGFYFFSFFFSVGRSFGLHFTSSSAHSVACTLFAAFGKAYSGIGDLLCARWQCPGRVERFSAAAVGFIKIFLPNHSLTANSQQRPSNPLRGTT